MSPTLLDIPFDHFQRYAAATHLLTALEMDAPRVLEVGANRQRLLGQFLPEASFLYTDLRAEGDEQDFVVADATQLPFADRSFDAVVSLDVLEHIPAELRGRAVAEMARVADRMVVIGCPPNEPWVREAELDANSRWHELYGEDYVWLQEHKEFGLVDSAEVEGIFSAAGLHILRFGQGNAQLWASLMGSHFLKVKFPELESLVAAADRLYNSRVFSGDHSDQPYREYYIGVRSHADAERLRSQPPFRGERDEEVTSMLSQLAEGLRKLALRTNYAELEWSSTAKMLDAYITDLGVAKREWSSTAEMLNAYIADLSVAKKEWSSTMEQLNDCLADLDAAKYEWSSTAAYAKQLEKAKDVSDRQWESEREVAQGLRERISSEREQADLREQALKTTVSEISEEARLLTNQVAELQQLGAARVEAYAQSRKRWQMIVALLGAAGLVAGLFIGRAWL